MPEWKSKDWNCRAPEAGSRGTPSRSTYLPGMDQREEQGVKVNDTMGVVRLMLQRIPAAE